MIASITHFIPRDARSGKQQLSWKLELKSANGIAVIGVYALKLAGCPHHHFQAPGFCPMQPPPVLDFQPKNALGKNPGLCRYEDNALATSKGNRST